MAIKKGDLIKVKYGGLALVVGLPDDSLKALYLNSLTLSVTDLSAWEADVRSGRDRVVMNLYDEFKELNTVMVDHYNGIKNE